jgi:hypothetical protein
MLNVSIAFLWPRPRRKHLIGEGRQQRIGIKNRSRAIRGLIGNTFISNKLAGVIGRTSHTSAKVYPVTIRSGAQPHTL